ncbi:putative sporulation protein YtxC [Hathewaya proteolytica DSM 3090]|uniref:Putative sporulation protein YtxC n=1 Tax=Hathewaya proteolytica DSM 3090 TaxID=1121331 RepID=A0A1M6QRM2_9CLOT|nr:putative sporulation protein YtxC [Hathewaya proteolytica]SHK22911.1 putative sporulation protein YtxC [Hathewaya proteolytica DSM 3090]
MLLDTIIYDHSMDEFIDIIKDVKSMLQVKKINVGIEEKVEDGSHIVKIYSVTDNEEENNSIRRSINLYLSMEIYYIMSKLYTESILKQFLMEKYFFLNKKEINYLIGRADETLNCDKIIIEPKGINYINRKNQIITQILNCLNDNREFNINGFITFRKNEVYNEFKDITDELVEDFIVEKEYKEFIKLLRYFVTMQECKISELNIIVTKDKNYYLLNKKGEDIRDDIIGQLPLKDKKISGIINESDLIIGGLITNVPKRIVIHGCDNNHDDELINTIKDIFIDRVAFCHGCEFCRIYKQYN